MTKKTYYLAEGQDAESPFLIGIYSSLDDLLIDEVEQELEIEKVLGVELNLVDSSDVTAAYAAFALEKFRDRPDVYPEAAGGIAFDRFAEACYEIADEEAREQHREYTLQREHERQERAQLVDSHIGQGG